MDIGKIGEDGGEVRFWEERLAFWRAYRGICGGTNMVVYRPEDFLRGYEQVRHLPRCHLEVHLGELVNPIS